MATQRPLANCWKITTSASFAPPGNGAAIAMMPRILRRRFASSWIYRITLNAVRDWQRAGRRRGRHADRYAEISPDEHPADQEDAATSGQLWAAVRRLPEKQRDAVLLVYAEELSHAAAADIMGIKEATVSFHVHEARKTLRGLL